MISLVHGTARGQERHQSERPWEMVKTRMLGTLHKKRKSTRICEPSRKWRRKLHQATSLGDEKKKVQMRSPEKRGERFHEQCAIRRMRMMEGQCKTWGEIPAELCGDDADCWSVWLGPGI